MTLRPTLSPAAARILFAFTLNRSTAYRPEQVVGTAGGTKYGYDKDGKPFLTKEPKLLLNDDKAGKVEGIHLMIGRRPIAAFGNSDGDREMLEYTKAGKGTRLAMMARSISVTSKSRQTRLVTWLPTTKLKKSRFFH